MRAGNQSKGFAFIIYLNFLLLAEQAEPRNKKVVELKIPDYVIEETLKPNHSFYKEVTSLEETLPKLDILYMTRVQKERFFNEEDYVRLKDTYILNREKLNLAQPDMPVLHPLPRVDEIVSDVDQDPRAAYFDQVQNGKYIRMALIMALLEIPDPLTGRTVL